MSNDPLLSVCKSAGGKQWQTTGTNLSPSPWVTVPIHDTRVKKSQSLSQVYFKAPLQKNIHSHRNKHNIKHNINSQSHCPAAVQIKQSAQRDMRPCRKISPSTLDRLKTQTSPSSLLLYYRRLFSLPQYYHTFVPITITTTIKYLTSSLLLPYYRFITIVPITVM